jgi:hypothetical protein
MRGLIDWRVPVIICLGVVLIGGIDRMTKDALMVKQLLKTIETHPPRSDGKELTAVVTEQELNAYIVYRLALEKRTPVTNLKVGLLDNNHIQGKIRLDAQQLNLGFLLGDVLDFDFKGIVQTRSGAARLDLTALQLGGQPVTPQMLDLVLGTVALYNGTESGRLDDWYALPKGVKRIVVSKGRAVLHY